MKIEQYKCDNCGDVKNSLRQSGWIEFDSMGCFWSLGYYPQITLPLENVFERFETPEEPLHFCSIRCLTDWFQTEIQRLDKKRSDGRREKAK